MHLARVRQLALLCGAIGGSLTALAAPVTKTYNENAPFVTVEHGAVKIGWYWTADQDFTWTGIEAMFGLVVDARTVTAEIYRNAPGAANLLRVVGFTPAAQAFAGGAFTGLAVSSGDKFFVGFQNVQGLSVLTPVFWDGNPGGTDFGPAWYSLSVGGNYELSDGSGHYPRLRFAGESGVAVVPEPSSALLAVGGLALLTLRLRRR